MTRVLDIMLSLFLLLLLSPFILVIAICIKLSSEGRVLFRQKRVGKHGIDFLMIKFRTMSTGKEHLGQLTVGGDTRITPIGRFLRKYKLDELPQLMNVLLGHMSIVGPRPEVRKYVALYTPEQCSILNVRPGITDFASIAYANEAELLAQQSDPEAYYIRHIMPEKIRLNMIFISDPSVANYFRVISLTVKKLFF